MNSGTRISKRQIIVFVAAMVLFGQVCLAKYSGGSGTAGAPYQIATAADLLSLAANTTDYAANFVLTADINLSASGPFTTAVIAPDTNSLNSTFDGNAFIGVFDGNSHTISNLTIDTNGAGNDYLGLFGKIGSSGQIKNLGFDNVNIIGGPNSIYLGGLAGWNASGASISNCYSTGNISGGTSSYHLGGLAGDNDGHISNCHSTGTINGGQNSQDLGGLVGFGGGTISDSYSTDDINGGNNAQYLGGLLGRDWGAGGTISNCYSTGTVKGGGSSQSMGGLIGFDNSGGVSNCYSSGDVNGGSGSFSIGGLVGFNYYAVISNCYSVGDVNGGSGAYNLGGLVGAAYSGTVSHCYFLEGSGPDDGNGMPLTDAQMKQQSSFSGWDFVNIWQIAEGVSYPKLAWQSSGVIKVTKCTVTAGSKGDSISFSGTMNATADDFNDANSSSDANFVEVTISDENSNDMDPCVITFPVNGKTWKKGKFGYSGTENGVKKSFTYVVKTGKFAFAASNINLSGLECPVIINIDVCDFAGTTEVNEAIVNGPKTPIPINFLMGVKNSLRIDKSKFTRNKNTKNITQFTVSGGFSVGNLNDANMATHSFTVTVGSSQTFTIPEGNFKSGKNKFTCSKVDTSKGIASATFDFNKCTFTLTIKNTNFTAAAGDTVFGIAFASFSGSDVVKLP